MRTSHLLHHGIAPRGTTGFNQELAPSHTKTVLALATEEHGLRAIMQEVRESFCSDPQAREYFDKMVANRHFERSFFLILSTLGLGLCAVLICDIVSEKNFFAEWHRWNEGERFILRFLLAVVGLACGIKAHDVFLPGPESADQRALVDAVTKHYRLRVSDVVPGVPPKDEYPNR